MDILFPITTGCLTIFFGIRLACDIYTTRVTLERIEKLLEKITNKE